MLTAFSTNIYFHLVVQYNIHQFITFAFLMYRVSNFLSCCPEISDMKELYQQAAYTYFQKQRLHHKHKTKILQFGKERLPVKMSHKSRWYMVVSFGHMKSNEQNCHFFLGAVSSAFSFCMTCRRLYVI